MSAPRQCILVIWVYANEDQGCESEIYPAKVSRYRRLWLRTFKRVARDRHLTMSRALVALAERGIQAEAEARQQLKSAYRDFVNEADPARKNEAGRDLIQSIFGTDSIAEDSVF